ncbi:MAG: SGNH/GDSL hydrolase family protein [Dongiaceae bacterium]
MSDGKAVRFNARMSMSTPKAGVSWSLFALRYIDCSTANAANPTPLDLRAALEYPAGTFWPATWPNNSQEIALSPGEPVESLMLPVTIPAGARFWVRVYGIVPAGGRWPLTSVLCDSTTGSGQEEGNSLPDKTRSGSIPNVGTAYSFLPPLAVTAEPADPAGCAAIGILGDSIAVGANDSSRTEYRGFAQRALANRWGWINLAEAGYALGSYSNTALRQWRWHAMPGLTHVFTNLGTNDLGAGAALGIMQTNLRTIAHSLDGLGIRLIPATLAPRTNAGNSGPRASDPAAAWATRRSYNAWLRGNPTGHGFVDLAAVTESGATGLWRTDLGPPSTDGIHPGPALHTAMRDQLLAALTLLLAPQPS